MEHGLGLYYANCSIALLALLLRTGRKGINKIILN